MGSTPSSTAVLSQRTVDYGEAFGGSASTLLGVWIYFNLVSNTILLPILVLTILASNQLRRHPTFINLCLTWIFSGIFSLLLFYTNEYKASEPPKALCIAQSSLLYGITPMWAVAVLALFYYIHQCLQGQSQETELGTIASWLMLGTPYFFQITFSTAALLISLRHPDLVSRGPLSFHCRLGYNTLAMVRAVFVSLCSGCVLVIEVLLLRGIYRNVSSARRVTMVGRNVSLRSVGRIFVFCIFLIFGAAVDLLAIIDPKSVLPQMYIATAGTVVFLVFGTQTDVLRVWFPFMFRPKPKKVTSRRIIPAAAYQNPQLGLCSDHTSGSGTSDGTRGHRPPSENSSFNLDELFPASPAPARVAPHSLYNTHYAM